MNEIPTFEGRSPDVVKFGFTGSVDMDPDDETQTALAMLGTTHAAFVVGIVEGAKYNFAVNKDDELVLTVTLRVLGMAEDTSDEAKSIFHQLAEEVGKADEAAEGDLFKGDGDDEGDDLLDGED